MTIMVWIKYAAKAVVAVLTILVAGIVGGELDIAAEWVVVAQAVIAGLSVFFVRNGDAPETS